MLSWPLSIPLHRLCLNSSYEFSTFVGHPSVNPPTWSISIEQIESFPNFLFLLLCQLKFLGLGSTSCSLFCCLCQLKKQASARYQHNHHQFKRKPSSNKSNYAHIPRKHSIIMMGSHSTHHLCCIRCPFFFEKWTKQPFQAPPGVLQFQKAKHHSSWNDRLNSANQSINL